MLTAMDLDTLVRHYLYARSNLRQRETRLAAARATAEMAGKKLDEAEALVDDGLGVEPDPSRLMDRGKAFALAAAERQVAAEKLVEAEREATQAAAREASAREDMIKAQIVLLG